MIRRKTFKLSRVSLIFSLLLYVSLPACASLTSIGTNSFQPHGRSLVVTAADMEWLKGLQSYLLPAQDAPPLLIVRGINSSRHPKKIYLKTEWLDLNGSPMARTTEWITAEVPSGARFVYKTRAPSNDIGDYRVYITESSGEGFVE